jgi:hypothetical protein
VTQESKTSNLLVAGEPGAGGRSFVLGTIVNAMAAQHPVRILDSGRNYAHFCRLMGGSVWHLNTNLDGTGTGVLETFDAVQPSALQVCDFGATTRPWDGPVPGFDDAFQRATGLLVVEDVTEIRARYPAIYLLISLHVAQGGSCCIVGRTDLAIEAVRAMCESAIVWKYVAQTPSVSLGFMEPV